jgi:hypothetical protein
MRVREHIVLDLVREGQTKIALTKHGVVGFPLGLYGVDAGVAGRETKPDDADEVEELASKAWRLSRHDLREGRQSENERKVAGCACGCLQGGVCGVVPKKHSTSGYGWLLTTPLPILSPFPSLFFERDSSNQDHFALKNGLRRAK